MHSPRVFLIAIRDKNCQVLLSRQAKMHSRVDRLFREHNARAVLTVSQVVLCGFKSQVPRKKALHGVQPCSMNLTPASFVSFAGAYGVREIMRHSFLREWFRHDPLAAPSMRSAVRGI